MPEPRTVIGASRQFTYHFRVNTQEWSLASALDGVIWSKDNRPHVSASDLAASVKWRWEAYADPGLILALIHEIRRLDDGSVNHPIVCLLWEFRQHAKSKGEEWWRELQDDGEYPMPSNIDDNDLEEMVEEFLDDRLDEFCAYNYDNEGFVYDRGAVFAECMDEAPLAIEEFEAHIEAYEDAKEMEQLRRESYRW